MSPENQGKTAVVWRGVLLAMVLTEATASGAGAQSSDGSFTSPLHFVQRDGEVIYRTVCQGCHMAAAQGAVGAGVYPALRSPAWRLPRQFSCRSPGDAARCAV